MAITCNAAPTTIAWRDITIGMDGDPCLTAESQVDGLDLVPVDAADLPVRMGSQPGRIAWPARDIAVTRVATFTPANTELLRAVMVALDADQAPLPLDITCPTMWPGTRRLWARARRCTSSTRRAQLVTRVLVRDLQWVALDPRLYSVAETEHDLDGNVSHTGNTAAPWRAELRGPISGPEIRRTDTNLAIRWPTINLGVGDTLAIDTRAQTAVIGATEVWGLSVDDDGKPPIGWDIDPGLAVPMTTNAPTGTVYVASAWL